MSAKLQELSFSGSMLVRGFWLYVWEVITKNGKTVLYIGMTGDSGSVNAQSPFNRMSQHLGSNIHSNALRRQLEKKNILPESCKSFNLIAYGPIFPEVDTTKEHSRWRSKIAALEKALADALHDSGYTVLNTVDCPRKPDQKRWTTVKKAFAQSFPKIQPICSRDHPKSVEKCAGKPLA